MSHVKDETLRMAGKALAIPIGAFAIT